MRIGVNTRFLLPTGMEGIGLYKHEVLRRMALAHPEDEFNFYFDRAFDPRFVYASNVNARVVFPPARHPLLWYGWFHGSLPWRLRRDHPEVFLSMDGFLPMGYGGKTAMVIHDLGFEHYPDHVPWMVRKYYQTFTPKYAKRADHIFAVSTATAKDLVNQYGISENKISIAYNGLRDGFRPMDEQSRISIRKTYSDGREYFLFVGALHPRKNIARLLQAFDMYKSKYGGSEVLLLTGRKAWMTGDIEAVYEAMKWTRDVKFLGYLELEALRRVTAGASVCFYPSLFEGFGVPLLEAMACEVPIVTSKVSCLPEIVGDAAVLIDPTNTEEMAQALHRVQTDQALRFRLIGASRQQVQKYSWDKTANHIYKTLYEMHQG